MKRHLISSKLPFFFIVSSLFLGCTGRNRKDLHTPKDDTTTHQEETIPNKKDSTTSAPSEQDICVQNNQIWRWEKCLTIDEAIATECATTAQGVFVPATSQRPAYCKHPEPTNEQRCLSSGYQYQWKHNECLPKDFLAWCLDTQAPAGIQHTVTSLLWTLGQDPTEKDCVKAANQLARSETIVLSVEHLSKVSGLEHYSPIIDLEPLRILSFSTKKLDLTGNQITDLEALKDLKKLEELNLSYNKIQEANTLTELFNLKKLSLQNNQITTIEWLPSLGNIEELFLSHNKIHDLSPLITPKHGWPNFTTLDLNHNKIQNPDPLESVSRLTHLYLEHNLIHQFKFLKVLLHLKTVHLDGNPLNPQSLQDLENIKAEHKATIHYKTPLQ